ncbi:unnamed protein product [Caenorhabditis nigoni]
MSHQLRRPGLQRKWISKRVRKNRQPGDTWKSLESVFQQLRANRLEEFHRTWRWTGRSRSGCGWREEHK